MMLVPSAVSANNMITDGYTAGDSVKLEKNTVADADTRVITGTVYDAATNQPMAGVRVQATGHRRLTTMTNAEGKYKLTLPSYATLLSFSTPEYHRCSWH